MRTRAFAARVRRGLRKPPRVLAARLAAEARGEVERFTAPRAARKLDILAAAGSASIDELWERLAARPYLVTAPAEVPEPERARIRAAAAEARARRVDLLGSGPVELGTPIDWHRDAKSGRRWEHGYARSLEIALLDEPCDVKWPWELSRMQWLVPAAQAYVLDGDERDARAVRAVLEEWLDANPYAYTVNWACTMDVALRGITWTWLFHAFASSEAWADQSFRRRFLTSLHLHGLFTERNLERSDVNGNHYTADAAGLVFLGLCLDGPDAARWSSLGWEILTEELPRQVFPDGVDFEASTAYHRLVTELFLLPALYRLRAGLPVPPAYAERLGVAARFVAAYSRPDGTSPQWGDADDARTLPLGGQPLGDHRYLVGLVAEAFDDESLRRLASGPADEARWLGLAAASGDTAPGSTAFRDGGVYVLRNDVDHVFVDCGPIGLSGRGGHGHNDSLSFEAVLEGVHLVADPGAYLYTASVEWRNRFRSTAFHNTPRLDGEEQSRFVAPDQLWHLVDDARPELRRWEPGAERDVLVVSHAGYRRLPEPVTPVRTFELEHGAHRLTVRDTFEGAGDHEVSVPLHLAPGVSVAQVEDARCVLDADGRRFDLRWSDPADWNAVVGESWWSPSYGVKRPIERLELVRRGPLRPLTVTLAPA